MPINSQLLARKPKDVTPEEFTKIWDNLGYSLDPLAQMLKEIIALKGKMAEVDFGTPNHYALLSFRGGQIAMAEKILALLPDSVQ